MGKLVNGRFRRLFACRREFPKREWMKNIVAEFGGLPLEICYVGAQKLGQGVLAKVERHLATDLVISLGFLSLGFSVRL